MLENKMSLKAFFEEIEKRLVAYSEDELRSILRRMAHNVSPSDRNDFLARLKSGEEAKAEVERVLSQDDLLSDIEDLAHEIGSEMEDADEYYDDDWDDEDSLGQYEEYVDPLTGLFDRAAGVFDFGNMPLAYVAYRKLFDVLNMEDAYGRKVSAMDLHNVDMSEARARYLHALYETTALTRRPDVLFEEMQGIDDLVWGKGVRLEDIIQVSPNPLPDKEKFFDDWIVFLQKQSGADADRWLREAIKLAQGTKGLEALSREEGKSRPRAYVDWIAALQGEGKHREVIAAAQEALQMLPPDLPIRSAIADHLCVSAQELNDHELVRQGRWEAFTAKPVVSRLLDLWEATPAGAQQKERMQQAAQHLEGYLARPSQRFDSISGWADRDNIERPAMVSLFELVHAYLLSGNWDSAHKAAAPKPVLGWNMSDNPQGLVIPAFLVSLAGGKLSSLPRNLSKLWQWGLQKSIDLYGRSADDECKRLESIYQELFARESLEGEEAEKLLHWCVDVAKRRANSIVENQHRKSYDKAAVLAAACAEVLRLRRHSEQADALINGLRSQFPRHRAFLQELNTAASQ
ncbi:MAG: hypothetical protein QME81_02840 [bacterium]|nr:hypothetical protein [bacterium]